MAKLKPSEFRLLLLFSIVAFALANMWGYKMLTDRHNALIVQKEQLIARLKTAEIYQRQEAESLQKRDWLTSRVPVYSSVDHMKTFLLKFVEQRASVFELVPELQPREPEEKDGYMRSVLEVKMSGSIDKIGEFLFSLQDPEEFRAITSFDLKSKPKDPLTVFAEFTIEQWWNPDSPSLVANSQAEPEVLPPVNVGGEGVAPPPTSEGSNAQPPVVPEPLKGAGIALPPASQTATPAPSPAGQSQLPVLNQSGNESN